MARRVLKHALEVLPGTTSTMNRWTRRYAKQQLHWG